MALTGSSVLRPRDRPAAPRSSRDASEGGIPAASPVPDLIQSPRLTVELERVVNMEPHMDRISVSRPDRQFYPFAASVIGGEKIATAKAQPLAIEHPAISD
jgi:hypothetical protein